MVLDELSEKVDEVTIELVDIVNKSGLPPVVIRLILQNVIGDVNNCSNKDKIVRLKKNIADLQEEKAGDE